MGRGTRACVAVGRLKANPDLLADLVAHRGLGKKVVGILALIWNLADNTKQ
jgi:hypothetical protein